jgi:hypothetical protein
MTTAANGTQHNANATSVIGECTHRVVRTP